MKIEYIILILIVLAVSAANAIEIMRFEDHARQLFTLQGEFNNQTLTEFQLIQDNSLTCK